ncbi:MAG: hypothetical protein J6Q70_03715, partial [Clostridia bacterium]|nr:hypothetical protein [Clostridia bacterium]
LTSSGVAYLSANGPIENFYDFEGKIPSGVELSPNGAVVCLKKSAISEKNIIIIFDKAGKIVYNDVTPQSVIDVAYRENVLFYTTYEGVNRLDLQSGELVLEEYTMDGKVLLAVNDKEVLLCSPQKAVYFTFRT